MHIYWKLETSIEMFIVVNVEDKLRVMPEEFDRPTADVLLERIQEKYVNKVNLVK